jgi:hypothetical protein
MIFLRLGALTGTIFALVRVGQRDTKWNSSTFGVDGYQGEEGNHYFYSGAAGKAFPTTAAPFIILATTFYHSRPSDSERENRNLQVGLF